jgi:hypothetical protein
MLGVSMLFELKAAVQLYTHADLEGVKLDTFSLTPRIDKWTNASLDKSCDVVIELCRNMMKHGPNISKTFTAKLGGST